MLTSSCLTQCVAYLNPLLQERLRWQVTSERPNESHRAVWVERSKLKRAAADIGRGGHRGPLKRLVYDL